jgi:hypothetical protein
VPDDDDDVPFWRRAAREPRQAQTEPSARNDISDQYIASEVSELDPDDVESDYVPSFTHSG